MVRCEGKNQDKYMKTQISRHDTVTHTHTQRANKVKYECCPYTNSNKIL